ncbi:MAG: helix-turn-helix domain-containing protein [Pseudanabaena sp. ELA607]|jgi:DNA-binding HxlR family transcriptional regulator
MAVSSKQITCINSENQFGSLPLPPNSCPVEATLKAIGGRWKVLILHELFGGTKRFGELHRLLQGITQKMLTQQLREMEQDGLVHRQVYLLVPPKVEYSLTDLGKTLKPVLDAMHDWGVVFMQHNSSRAPSEHTISHAD